MVQPSRSRVDRTGLDLVHIALCTDVDEFRRETFHHIDRLIGCDTCVSWGFPLSRSNATLVGASPTAWDRYLSDVRGYDADMMPLHLAAARAGAAQDIDVISPRARERSRFYREIIASIGVRCFLVAPLMRMGRLVGVVNFGRFGRHYDSAHADVLKRLAAVLAVGEAMHATSAPCEDSVAALLLSPREREVVSLMRTGLSNREIGAVCGMSHNTVRNHLASAYAKTGATNRLELLRFLREGAAAGEGGARRRRARSEAPSLRDEPPRGCPETDLPRVAIDGLADALAAAMKR